MGRGACTGGDDREGRPLTHAHARKHSAARTHRPILLATLLRAPHAVVMLKVQPMLASSARQGIHACKGGETDGQRSWARG